MTSMYNLIKYTNKFFPLILKLIICLCILRGFEKNIMCCHITPLKLSVKCNDSLDIKQELQELSDNLTEENKNFKLIELQSGIHELPDNVFHDISFEEIKIINASNLQRIHRNSFNSTKYTTKTFLSWENYDSKLRNEPPEYDLYAALSSLVSLTEIYLSLGTNMSHEIPDRAFQPVGERQDSLNFIEIYGYFTISRIGRKVFYELPNLKNIVFKHTIIESISAEAFSLRYDKSQYLTIIMDNTSLTENSFEPGVFTNCKRPVRVDLSNNKIKYIEETTFGLFFELNLRNYIRFDYNPLNCSDIKPFEWILRQKSQLQNHISGAVCANGTQLWDLILEPDHDPGTTPSTASTIASSSSTSSTTTEGTTVTDRQTTTTPVLSTESKPGLNTKTETGTHTESTEHDSHSSTASGSHSSTDPGSTSTYYSSTDSEHYSPSYSSTEDSDNDPDGTQLPDIIHGLEDMTISTENENSMNSSEELIEILDRIQSTQNLIDSMVDLDSEMSLNLTTNIINVLSNLLNQNNAWISTTKTNRTIIAAKILSQIEISSFFLICNRNNSDQSIDRIVNRNIIINTYKNFYNDIHFEANDSSITVPKEVIETNGMSYCGNSSFTALINRLDNYMSEGLSDEKTINTQIINYSLMNTSDTIDLENGLNIKFSLRHKNRLEFGDKIVCVFWDFQSMQWSSEGCQILTNESNRDVTVCLCSHLTNFAALMDMSGRERNDQDKSILTNIFCGISIICLILTVWLLLKPQRKHKNSITDKLVRTRTVITLNLAIMLTIADILIIFGMDRIHNKGLCQSMSALLLYSLLASFSWMLLEGYQLYRMTVQIFSSDPRNIYLYLFGYGIPFVIIIFGLLAIWIRDRILLDALIGEYFCWISSSKHPDHIWLLIGPALIAIAINILLMYYLIKQVKKSNDTKPDNTRFRLLMKQIFGITSLIFNLGITWLSFILYIKQFGYYFSIFSYVFIVLNGSQGIFIFVYHLVIHLYQKQQSFEWSLRLSNKLSNKWSTKTTDTEI